MRLMKLWPRDMLRTLLLDVETAPHNVYVWGLYGQNVAINQIRESGYTLCWAAKWHGQKGILFDSLKASGMRRMVRHIHKLLDEADEIITFNGKKFDIPTLNWEFLKAGLNPPSPYQHIDLYQDAKKFRKASGKLDYICRELGLGQKTQHKGYELWTGCMTGDTASWKLMERYNRNDVALLEKLYDRMRAWRKTGINRSVYIGDAVCCKCGSSHLQSRGWAFTAAGRYPRMQCQDCGTWNRGNLQNREPRKLIGLTP